MALYLTELFRHFVFLNKPMTRFSAFALDRNTRLDLCMAIGPFSNPASVGMHQRLLTLLLGIAVRQLGIAAPTMTSYVMQQWNYTSAYFIIALHWPSQGFLPSAPPCVIARKTPRWRTLATSLKIPPECECGAIYCWAIRTY